MTQNEINEQVKQAINTNIKDIQTEHDRINYCISEIKKLKEQQAQPVKKAIDSNTIALIAQILLIVFMLVLVIRIITLTIL